MKIIETRGVQIATETFGSRSHPAIILIMGATASMLGWPDELCVAMAERGLFVVRFDHRDTGCSTTVLPGAANYSIEDMAVDVVAVMDDYGLKQASLFGMSLGGLIAQILALTHSQRVRSVILLGSEPLGWDGAELPYISQSFLDHFGGFTSLNWSNRNEVVEFLLKIDSLSSGTGYTFDKARSKNRIEEFLARAQNPASMFNHATVSELEKWTGRFREIRCPVLVVHGEDDPILPIENGKAIAAGIEGAELAILNGVGHELPAATIPKIVELIAAHMRRFH